jgi:hypothetical protein
MIRLPAAALAAVAFCSTSAWGQQQTVENALTFLERTLPNNLLEFTSNTPDQGWNYLGTITTFRRTGRCTAAGTGYWPYRRVGDRWWNAQNRNLNWDFSHFAEVTHDNFYVRTAMVQGARFTYSFSSRDLAARVAFAMNFLRTRCDPNANLGF